MGPKFAPKRGGSQIWDRATMVPIMCGRHPVMLGIMHLIIRGIMAFTSLLLTASMNALMIAFLPSLMKLC